MKKIVLVLLAMVMLTAVPCLAFDFPGHLGQIPLCQNNKTGALRFPPVRDIDQTAGVNYEPYCNTRFFYGTTTPIETLIWVDIRKAPLEPMTSVPEANLTAEGWTECYSDLYTDAAPLSTILSQCNKNYLMLACRPVGSATFTVAAFANRSDVLTDTGEDYTSAHIANGAGWYYNSDWSWGFAKAGDPVYKAACDTLSTPNPELRLSWYTYESYLGNGCRCGVATNLNSDSTWQRVILHHD
ncbi:MAG: hypothetical protein ACXWMS_09855 [Syntrophales bacterium]